MVVNKIAKLLWNFGLHIDRHASSIRPDIVLISKSKRKITLFELSCPTDDNMLGKEQKVNKYQVLIREMYYCYDQPVDIVPAIFGHSCVVSCDQQSYLKKIQNYSVNLFNTL